ncbi:MAG TPA: 2OG-Fe(II) oxygenase [Steroidobacteraceae bacterium]|jgi:Rps23 Pro-64 3,4-dihydroxylase Tpa1-like proline 4-hydroxylase
MALDRRAFAGQMLPRITSCIEDSARQWRQSAPVNHFVIDDLLSEEWVHSIRQAFPPAETMMLKSSLRELKYVAAQMDKYNPLLEEIIYAFQEPEIINAVGQITNLRGLEPDSMLYAGGISLMACGHFLNPHVDNSHDKFRQRYRVLNLLYYVSPDWTEECGGNLELWPNGPTGRPLTIVNKFNRLVVMVTHRDSWHSVSQNRAQADRCCVSNYYFSNRPTGEQEYFHVTSFRGRPEQPIRDLVLRGDIWLRMMIRRILPGGIKNNLHYYKRSEEDR